MSHGITLIAVIHIVIAFFLVVFVLLQDGKGGGVGGSFGGGSSQTIFGATGAANFLVKLTRGLAVCFMITCLGLTILLSRDSNKSVIDALPAAAPQAPGTDAAKAAAPVETPKEEPKK